MPTDKRIWLLLMLFGTACGEVEEAAGVGPLQPADASTADAFLQVAPDASEPAVDAAEPPADAAESLVDAAVPPVDAAGPSIDPAGPVFAAATFEVRETEDVVFAQGLSHAVWGSGPGQPMDLTLDIFEPIGHEHPAKPVVVVIHGGGFTGGSSKHAALSAMARAFAERGWVAFSISYRLARDRGTLPANYPMLAGGRQNQLRALYPACRDAKAAIRWIRAHAAEYGLHPEYITAIGGSAGSFIAVALGATDEGDCTTEIEPEMDHTLAGTHLEQSSRVATVIDHWGGIAIVTVLEAMGGPDRFDPTDAPISIVHGTEDPTVNFHQAEILRDLYQSTGVPYAFHPLEGQGHGPWGARVDGRTLTRLASDFIVEQQGLEVR